MNIRSSRVSRFCSTSSVSVANAFTIVELLVVIVIIGILAAVTIVSYNGINQRAVAASLQSDLNNAATQLKMFSVDNGIYPGTVRCDIPDSSTNKCIKSSSGNTFAYAPSNATNPPTFSLTATNASANLAYYVTENSTVAQVIIAASFAVALGGPSIDVNNAVTKTNDLGYATVGYTTSYGAGSYDALLAKYDASSSLIWKKTWGGAGDDESYSIAQAGDGGYVIAGRTATYGAGGNDAFLAKFDSAGNLSWNKTWGGSGSDEAQDVIATSDGGYVVVGDTASYGAGSYDALIAKFDSSGNLVWNKIWGGAGLDLAYSVVQTSDGGYAVAGYTASFGAGGVDAFLIKYDSSGNLSWNKTWGGTSDDYFRSIVQTSDGGYAVAGTYGTGNDALLAKFDSSGNLSWNKAWGEVSYIDIAYAVAQTSDGGYAMAGETRSYGNGVGMQDAFLAKYDSGGNLSWNKTWGSASDDTPYSMVQTNDGGYALAGRTNGYGAGGYDSYLLKFKADGSMNNCSSPMCQSPSARVTSPAASVASPAATVSSPAATVNTPSATVATPAATYATVVSP